MINKLQLKLARLSLGMFAYSVVNIASITVMLVSVMICG
jgi:hypothetical protein